MSSTCDLVRLNGLRLQSPQQKTLANHRRVPIYRARVVRSPEQLRRENNHA